VSIAIEIVALMVSAVHAFEGRPQEGARPDPEPVGRDEVEVHAGLGIVGDRYYNQKVHKNAAVTFLAAESLDQLAADLELSTVPDPLSMRRNVVLRGFPIDTLAKRPDVPGRRFSVNGVEFQANRPANPCAWMNVVLAPGAMKALRGHGGVRTTPLTSGVLRVGPAELVLLD